MSSAGQQFDGVQSQNTACLQCAPSAQLDTVAVCVALSKYLKCKHQSMVGCAQRCAIAYEHSATPWVN